jgi:hypothetical protein
MLFVPIVCGVSRFLFFLNRYDASSVGGIYPTIRGAGMGISVGETSAQPNIPTMKGITSSTDFTSIYAEETEMGLEYCVHKSKESFE